MQRGVENELEIKTRAHPIITYDQAYKQDSVLTILQASTYFEII